MKIFTVCMFVFTLGVSASGYSQKQLVTLDLKQSNVIAFFNEISQQTGLQFIYNNADVKDIVPITVKVNNQMLENVLNTVFAQNNLEFQFESDIIYISVRRQSPRPPGEINLISGKVTDSQNAPLPGVTVRIKNSNLGVASDIDGNFKISVMKNQPTVLIFSFIGYTPREITVKDNTPLTIVLNEQVKEMDEVVVTGIFNKTGHNNTGAISVISEKEIKRFGNRNIIETLSNIDPSIHLLTNNEWGSNPNRLPEIQIRGASSLPDVETLQSDARANINTPLVILDGFETDLQRILDMDVEEIASASILKDASATAIYGSRGSNGVIVITTKLPLSGKLRVSYFGTLNLEVPDLSDYHLLNARDKLELERLSGYYENERADSDIALKIKYNSILQNVMRGVNTDWLSKPLRIGVGHRNNLKIEGGDQIFRYSTSLQYQSTEGVMKDSYRKNFNGTINLSYTRNKLSLRNYLSVGVNKSSESPYGSFSQYAKLNPYWTNHDEKGKIRKVFDNSTFFTGSEPINPMYNATLNVINTTNYVNITDNLNLEWRPFEGFRIEAKFGISHTNSHADNFKPRDHTDFKNYPESEASRKGKYEYNTSSEIQYTLSTSVNYNHTWAEKHLLSSGLFLESAEDNTKSYGFIVEGFSHESLDFLSMALQYEKDGKPNGQEAKSRRIGLVGNINYSYMNRYVVDASARVDGDSKYGSDKRYAPFWSVGFAWNMHEEEFLNNVQFVNKLKWRTGVGVTGANNFNAYDAIATYVYYVGDRYKEWMGSHQNILDNPALSWQKTMKYNTGLEINMLNHRLNVIMDLYYERTNGLVSKMELKPSNGFKNYAANIGKVENKGMEFKVSAYILRNTAKKSFWSISGGLVHNQDKIISLSEDIKKSMAEQELKDSSVPNRIWREGDSQNAIYVVPSQGIDPSTGKELYVKKNGNITYTWNAADRIKYGNLLPKFHGNLNTNLQFRNLEFSISFAYQWGQQIYNSTLIDRVENADKRFNVDERVFRDRWNSPGDRTFFKGIKETSTTRYTSRFVQNERILECKNIQFCYRLENLKALHMSSLTFTLNAADPFRLSTTQQERGIQYPFSRQFSLMIRAIF